MKRYFCVVFFCDSCSSSNIQDANEHLKLNKFCCDWSLRPKPLRLTSATCIASQSDIHTCKILNHESYFIYTFTCHN